jgi:hypothetical protein
MNLFTNGPKYIDSGCSVGKEGNLSNYIQSKHTKMTQKFTEASNERLNQTNNNIKTKISPNHSYSRGKTMKKLKEVSESGAAL